MACSLQVLEAFAHWAGETLQSVGSPEFDAKISIMVKKGSQTGLYKEQRSWT